MLHRMIKCPTSQGKGDHPAYGTGVPVSEFLSTQVAQVGVLSSGQLVIFECLRVVVTVEVGIKHQVQLIIL